ncbi:MAG: TatD family hydrolase [Oscillospiraceae bacterium]|nr:TatD family hydrolase [Oscillospiraceae bacterium]MBQ9980975.1 TatD family hydrolase [Oscillospiraceae bacterium]
MLENIFDTHAHYTEESFDDDRDELITAIHKNGVKYIMLSVSDIEDTKKALSISRNYPFVYSAAGVHPECVANIPSDYIQQIEKIIVENKDKIKAIGEIGLDYHYEDYDASLMKEVFTNQLILAQKTDLPVIIHSRDATKDTLDVLRKHTPKKGVVHCFSGSAQTARELVEMGLHISFTGVITFKNARKALEALEVIPLDRLMLETDCPFMAPVPYRGKRCDSSMITEIAKKAAEIKGISPQEMLDVTCKTAMKFFDIKE